MTDEHDSIAQSCISKLNEVNFVYFSYKFHSKGKKRFIETSWEDDQGFKTKKIEEWED